MGGFFLPLSGGVDSASVALIVSSMCHMVVSAVKQEQIQLDLEESEVEKSEVEKSEVEKSEVEKSEVEKEVTGKREKDARVGQVLEDVRALTRQADYTPTDPVELCGRLLVTAYMGTKNSSAETQARAAALAVDVGSYHVNVGYILFTIDKTIMWVLGLFSKFQ